MSVTLRPHAASEAWARALAVIAMLWDKSFSTGEQGRAGDVCPQSSAGRTTAGGTLHWLVSPKLAAHGRALLS
jgi:hypothetical protein